MPLVIPIFIPHRGCPHDCLFCNQQKISGHNRQEETRYQITKTIEEWLERSPNRQEVQVAFFGGSFTCLPVSEQKEMLASVQPYIRSGKVDCIRVSTRPDCVTREICTILREYSVGVVEIGVQSLTPAVLRQSQRGHTPEQCWAALSLLKSCQVQVGVQLMPGLPGESSRSFLKVIDQIIEYAPDFIRMYPTVVVMDSGLEKLYHSGGYQPLSLGKAVVLTSRCYEKLTGAAIPVVRMGLQPSESLDKSVVAGPYHPAFGELVRSRLWLKKMRTRLSRLRPGEQLGVRISHRDHSAVVGRKRQNIKRLDALGFSGRFKIMPDKEMARGSIKYVVS